jgi:peptidoglycan lytic transglycosylase B
MLTVLFAMLLLQAPVSSASGAAASSDRVDYVVAQLVKGGYTQQDAEALFQDKRLEVLPPQKVQPREIDWDAVIAALVAPPSVARGAAFLTQYKAALEQGEKKYGVDPALLTAVLRLESNLGLNTGNYVAFNVLYTLLTQQTEERRWRWAGDNLAALAAYCKSRGADCFQFRSSYAGALGPAQFLPFSVREYGVDGNGDNIVDPFQMEDAIVSAANFLAQHDWEEDPAEALAQYYGSREGYVRAVFAYAGALRAGTAAPPASSATVFPAAPLPSPPAAP